MDKRQKTKLKAALEEQRGTLMEELRRHEGAEEFGERALLKDSEERAAILPEMWVENSIVANDHNLLEKIDLALKRIDEGDYGTCTNCQEAIPVARLVAKPSVSLCVTCQEKKDKGEL